MDTGIKFGLGGTINNQLTVNAPDFDLTARDPESPEAQAAGPLNQGAVFQPGNYISPDQLERKFQQELAARQRPTGMADVWQAIRKARDEDMDVQRAVSTIGAVARRLPPDQLGRMPKIIQGGGLDEVWAFRQQHPDLEDLLTLPEFHQVFGDKLKPLSTAAKVWYSLPPVSATLGFQRGWMNLESRKVFQHAFSGKSLQDPQFLAERMAFEQERQALIDEIENISFQLPKWAALSSEFGVNAGDMVGGMARGALTPEGAIGLLLGGTLGALSGGTGAMAVPALTGGLLGATTAMSEAEAGDMMWEIWENMPDEAKDETLVRLAGLMGFGATAGLEFAGAHALFSPTVGRAVSRTAVRSMGAFSPKLAASAERVLSGSLVGGLAEHMVPEVATEALQEGFQTWGQRPIADLYNERYSSRGLTMEAPTMGDVATAMGQAAWQAFWGGASLGAVHPIIEAWSGRGDPAVAADLARQTAETAEKRLHLETVNKGNESLRQNAKSLTENLRQMAGPNTSPEATQAVLERLGDRTAFVNAEVLGTMFQSAVDQRTVADQDALQTEFLDHLGVTAEQFQEALENGTDVRLDLTGLPHVVDNPLWDQVAENLTVEPLAVTREMQADLEAMGPPPVILPKANAEVRPEVRAELENQMTAAGRTKSMARREVEFSTRQFGLLARIMGTDVNTYLPNLVEFGREDGRGEGERYFQPSLVDGPTTLYQSTPQKDVFGQAFAEYRGRPGEAIEHLVNVQQGHVPGAFFREELGVIDLPWGKAGKKGFGLAHIIERRESAGFDGLDFARSLPAIIQEGKIEQRPGFPGRAYIVHDESEAVIGLEWLDTQRTWLLTAYPWTKENAPKPRLDSKPNDRAHGDGQRLPPSHSEGVNIIIDQLFAKDKPLFQGREDAPRGWTDFLSGDRYRVIFTAAADASTAMHEFQHIFINEALRVLDLPLDQIADPEARHQLAADIKTLEDYAGVKDGVWTREAHERVAEAFEVYMMEGKAPVKGLRGLFSQMKKLLLSLYDGLKRLETPMTDDVRGVFDRQLASEEEILAERWRTEPAFDAAELSAMREADPALVAEYEAARQKGLTAAEEEITAHRNAERERLTRQWRREGLEEARLNPRQVRLGEIKKAGGINRASLEAGGYDAETIRTLQRRYPGLVSEKGRLGFDEFAEQYGFEAGDDFLSDILDTPTIQELTERYVAEREAEFQEYFDAESVITDAELDLWETERNLWARHMGSQDPKYRARGWRDLKRIIDEKTGLKSVDEISAQNMADLKASLKAQQRAARAAEKAGMEKGEAKGYLTGLKRGRARGRNEARGLALDERLELAAKLKSLAERQREIDKTVAGWRRLVGQKRADMYKPGGVLPAYQIQIKNILAEMGLGTKTQAENSLADFVDQLEIDGAPVAVPDWIRNGQWPTWENGKRAGTRKTYRGLSYNQFLELKDAVANLEFLGRRQQKVNVEGRLVNEDDAARDLMGSIAAHHEIRPPKEHGEVLAESGKQGVVKGLLEGLGGYISSLIKTETMARRLDGGVIDGLAQRLIYKPINAAYGKAQALTDDLITGKLKAVVDSTIGAQALLKWRGEKVAGEGLKWVLTTEQRVLYALNCGNPQNLKALRNYRLGEDGAKLSDTQHQALLDSLTEEQWKFVQSVWDFMDHEMYPRLNELTLNTMGIPLRKVEAAPVRTKFGELRGGYFPLKFDRRMSERADRYADAKDVIRSSQGLYSKPNTRSGATIEREGTTYKDLVPMLSFDVLTRSLNDNIHDLTHREAVNDIWRILRRPQIREAIDGTLGDNYWVQIKRWLQEVAKPEQVGDPGGRNILRKVRSNVSTAAMALKVSVMLCQVTGVTQSIHKLGTYWTAVGMKEFYKNPMAAAKLIYEKSPALKNRNKTSYDRDVHDVLSMRNPLAATLKEKWVDVAFKPIAVMDQAVANPVWLGAYLKAVKEGKAEADAVYFADSVVRVTQPTGAVKDLSRAQRGWGYGDAGKLLTMFSTFFSGTQNLIWEQYHETKRDFRQGNYLKGTAKAGRAAFFLAVLPALMETLIKGGPPEDEEELADIGKGVVSFLIGGMPVVKDAVSYWMGDSFRFRPAPVLDAMESILNAPGGLAEMVSGEGDAAKGLGQVVRGLGPLTGLPSGQIGVAMKGMADWDENEGLEAFYRLLVREPQ